MHQMRWILMQEVSLQEYWNNIGTSNVLLVALLLLPHLWSTANKVSPRIASRHAGELAMDESGNITRTNTSRITLSPAGFDSCASFPIATARSVCSVRVVTPCSAASVWSISSRSWSWMRHTASMNPSVRLLTTPYDSISAPSIPLAGFDRASAVDLPCMPCLSVCHFWSILARIWDIVLFTMLSMDCYHLYTRTEHYLSSSSLRHPGAHAFCRLVSKQWLQFIDSSPLLLSALCIASISSSSTYPVPTALLSSIVRDCPVHQINASGLCLTPTMHQSAIQHTNLSQHQTKPASVTTNMESSPAVFP